MPAKLYWKFIKWLMVAAAAASWWIPAALGDPTKEGQAAFDFSLPDLSGNTVSLSYFKGQWVVLDFWATWCLPCRKSLPELAALEKKHRDQGVVVLGLSIDDPDSYDNAYIKRFLEKYGVDYRILRASPDVVDHYLGKDKPSVPTLFLVDAQGRIVEIHEGYSQGSLEVLFRKSIGQMRGPNQRAAPSAQ